MKKGIFVTGTGTAVGKTVVTAGILQALRKRGVNAAPMKPIQSGGERHEDGLRSPDLFYCLEVAGMEPEVEQIKLMNPYCYEPACSPHLAARMANDFPDYDKIMDAAEALFATYDLVLVEGAGGVMVPLDDEEVTMLDMIEAFDFPVILVANARLGTINHTLLSINSIVEAGVDLMGVVLVNTTPADGDEFIREDNEKMIEKLGRVPILGNIRYLQNLAPENDTAWAEFSDDFKGLDNILKDLDQ